MVRWICKLSFVLLHSLFSFSYIIISPNNAMRPQRELWFFYTFYSKHRLLFFVHRGRKEESKVTVKVHSHVTPTLSRNPVVPYVSMSRARKDERTFQRVPWNSFSLKNPALKRSSFQPSSLGVPIHPSNASQRGKCGSSYKPSVLCLLFAGALNSFFIKVFLNW